MATEERFRDTLPVLSADLVLMHAPAVFDFRERRDIYFPFLGTSGDVPITPLYEYFPVGYKTLQSTLTKSGFTVRILNLSTILLRYPGIEIDRLFSALNTGLIGIDLHWMVHVQGSLEIAERLKQVRSDISILFGGISSTYYADELIRYRFIDMVMRGYETHEPMIQLLQSMRRGEPPRSVANLLWKDPNNQIQDNQFSHTPDRYACDIDWSHQPDHGERKGFPILELLSTQNAGCAYNCGWCGGSREAFRRINGRKKAMARKSRSDIAAELASMNQLSDIDQYHFYSVGSYNESTAGMDFFVDRVAESDLHSVSYEQFHLTPEPMLKRMVAANKKTAITLSPESHDPRVAKLAGRGVYTNDEMEQWLARAIEIGIHSIDIWYFIGMPEQDEASVRGSVDYSIQLLEKFKGQPVNPMICPMIPFLDPASTFFEHPDEHGYRVFYRTVEEHRQAMKRASIINRINYETRWLSRRELVEVGFVAVRDLMQAKASLGFLPKSFVSEYNVRIDDALRFIGIVHEADCIEDKLERARELEKLGTEILRRNNAIFRNGVMNQAFPVHRSIGGRWFDELGWTSRQLDVASDQGRP